MTIDDAIRHALSGRAILFIGAGFSREAKNLDNENLYTTEELLIKLKKYLNIKVGNYDLPRLTKYYLSQKGPDELINFLVKKFTIREITKNQIIISGLPWAGIYTTNYDNVIEMASNNKFSPIMLSDPVSIDNDVCVHLNGYIPRINSNNLEKELKLTSSSYDLTIEDANWVKFFRSKLRAAAAVIFIGYSMPDLDIRRLFAANNENKDKCIFIDKKDLDPISINELQQFGSVFDIGVDRFVTEINKIKKNFIETPQDQTICLSFTQYKYSIGTNEVSDNQFLDLMMYGKYDNSLRESQPYLLYRSEIDKVIDSLNSGYIPVIHSGLANGKTMLVNAICNIVSGSFDRIFFLTKNSPAFIEELKLICRSKPVLIVIENYNLYFDLLKDITTFATSGVKLLLTARSTAHDFFYERLKSNFTNTTITDHKCDRLSDSDISWFVNAFDNYGLWGEYTTNSPDWKFSFFRSNNVENYVPSTINGQVHSILLYLLKSPDIKKRILNEYNSVKQNKDSYDILNAIFILSAVIGDVSVENLENIFGVNVLNSDMIRGNHPLRIFVNFDANAILVKSSAIAIFLLQEADLDDVLNLLGRIHSSYSKVAMFDEYYRTLSIQLVRFANVKQILKRGDDYSYVLKYYSNIKVHPARNQDPLFWMQYATACTEAEYFYQAENYFSTARGCAKKRSHWNTFQIDNREAIFLLKKAIAIQDYTQAMTLFTQAKLYINSGFVNFDNEKIRKPFNPPVLYMDFWLEYKDSLLKFPKKLEGFRGAVNNAFKHVCKLPPEISNHPDIIKCHDTLKRLIDCINESIST